MADPCPPHVLFIDDDPASRDLATRILTGSGWTVTAIEAPNLDPQEVARLAPDALVVDYWFGREPLAMPFLERLRAVPETARIPVLLVSAATFAVAEDRERIDRLADGVLFKPYAIGDLRGAVARFLAPVPA